MLTVSPVELGLAVDDEATDEVAVPDVTDETTEVVAAADVTDEVVVQEPNADWQPVPQ